MDFGEHGGEPLDQRQQPLVWHRGDEIVKHAPLTEQRMSALFRRIRFQVPVVPELFSGGPEQCQQDDGQRIHVLTWIEHGETVMDV